MLVAVRYCSKTLICGMLKHRKSANYMIPLSNQPNGKHNGQYIMLANILYSIDLSNDKIDSLDKPLKTTPSMQYQPYNQNFPACLPLGSFMKSVKVVCPVYLRSSFAGIGGIVKPAVLGCISTSIVSELSRCDCLPDERCGDGLLGKSIR